MEVKINCMVRSFVALETKSTAHYVECWEVVGAGLDTAANTVCCSLITSYNNVFTHTLSKRQADPGDRAV